MRALQNRQIYPPINVRLNLHIYTCNIYYIYIYIFMYIYIYASAAEPPDLLADQRAAEFLYR